MEFSTPILAHEVVDPAYVLIPHGTLIHINGIPANLITEAVITTAYGNMQYLVGHHLAMVPQAPSEV